MNSTDAVKVYAVACCEFVTHTHTRNTGARASQNGDRMWATLLPITSRGSCFRFALVVAATVDTYTVVVVSLIAVVVVVVNRNRITCQLPHTKLKELLCQVRPGYGACPCDSI